MPSPMLTEAVKKEFAWLEADVPIPCPEGRMSTPPEAPVTWGKWELVWIGPAREDGARPSQPVKRDQEAIALLADCGDGSQEHPWKAEALKKLAKHLRKAPDIVHDHLDVDR